VTSVKYRDTDNAEQTLSSAAYLTDTGEAQGIVRLLEDESWPDTYFDRPSAVVVRAVVGFGATSASVPENYIQAMQLLIGHWYANRESVVVGTATSGVGDTADALLGLDHARAMIG
jgi:hypothetical protein